MAKKDLKLTVETRERIGTTGSQGLRRAGKFPAVIYGHGAAPQHVAIDQRTFEELLHHGGRTAIITLEDGNTKGGETAMVRAVQYHPVNHHVLHADLLRVSADEKVSTELQVVTTGVARGVRDAGGVMDVITHQLEIEGPASKIPEHLEIDVTALGIHEHVTAAEVKLPAGFTMLTPPETIVVAIEASRTEHELEEAAAGPTEAAEPEVIGSKPEGSEG